MSVSPAADAATVPVTVSLPPKLAAKLADPGVAESLTSLLSHADLVAILVEGLDGLLERSEVIGDALLEGFGDLRTTVEAGESGIGFDPAALVAGIKGLLGALPQAASIATPETVEQLAVVARGLTAGGAAFASSPVETGGLFSLVKLLKDPDIARAVSYVATVAKALGRELGQ